ncbi:AAA family ATPase [Bernardetia sp. ABR2-2B]|uniref:TrlF family AAA-like ATPase n=1 Tax=Bernardetia sp. ABR2-2B TaxID=3127472 RepID=UPI0030CDEB44
MQIFQHGSTWLRADFHLHTKADKEFKFDESNNTSSFKKEYVERLQQENIGVGVITNHNKFDLKEFKSLRKEARKEEIYLMAGVELSVNDGSNGIHCLIVFDYENWIDNSVDYINQFLDAAFEGIPNRENENARCKYGLQDLLKKLDEHSKDGRDNFIIMAHVNQNSGFLKELNGGRITEFAQNSLFKKIVLGFQKFRDYGKLEALNNWFENVLPAFVEGSDCKSIEGVGVAHKQNEQDKKCFIKLGEYEFNAVKYAFSHHKERIANEKPNIQDCFLKKIIIETNDTPTEIKLNPNLNTVIGMRGGGKSTLLETIRFGLDILPEQNNSSYKEDIVKRFLGQGREMTLEFFDKQDNLCYKIKRTQANPPQIFDADGNLKKNLKIENIIEIAYFGQKDLEEVGKDFNEKIIKERILNKQLITYQEKIRKAGLEVKDCISNLQSLKKQEQNLEITENKIAVLKEQIDKFKEYGLEQFIQKEIDYSNDEAKLESIKSTLNEIISKLKIEISQIDISTHLDYQSNQEESQKLFKNDIIPCLQKIEDSFKAFEKTLSDQENIFLLKDFLVAKRKFTDHHNQLKVEFEEIKKQINQPDADVEKHKQNEKDLIKEQDLLNQIKSETKKLEVLENKLTKSLETLQTAWKEEFDFINSEINKLNALDFEFEIQISFQGNKENFSDWLQTCTRQLQKDKHIKKIVEHYDNPINIYKDLYKEESELKTILSGGHLFPTFIESFEENINDFLTYKVPDKYVFLYDGKDLQKYSIGQKATALIAFILANEQKKLFIIDQPEDDLDNFTVADKIVERVKDLKPTTQFIFVTHNPNILALGDSEQIIICEYDEENQKTQFANIGSIDNPKIQQAAIRIMEGGKEAFSRREKIYQTWK